MKNLYLIRHGEILRDGNMDDQSYPLIETGIQHAKEVAFFLENYIKNQNGDKLIFSSSFLRAIMTATEISKKLLLPIEVIDNIHEMQFGNNEAKPKEQWLFEAPFRNNEIIPKAGLTENEKFLLRHLGGESPNDVLLRVVPFVDLIKRLDTNNIIIIGHGVTLRMMEMILDNKSISWYYQEPIPNHCSVKKLTLNNNCCTQSNCIYKGF